MKLTFLGAAREVTGSLYYLEVAGKRIVIDCGMEQGRDTYVNGELPISPADVDALILTHAHIDHSGKIPLMYARGFRGPIYATEATTELCGIMLMDSAHIQEMEAQWASRKAARAGKQPPTPMYTCQDAQDTLKQFVPARYGVDTPLFDGVTARFTDAGHLLGSASVTLTLTENGQTRTLVFSGDIGNINQPLLNDPKYLSVADYAVIESTYGDRSHGDRADYIGQLTEVLQSTFDKGGNVVIPSFAVGRTQEMLYFIREIKQKGLVKGHDGFTVYVDSPLAIECTHIFDRTNPVCFDPDTNALIESGVNPIWFDGLTTAVTSDESKQINFDPSPSVIISASGMCEAGRIRHHLKHNLWRDESTVLFVGYQADGSLGRLLQDGAEEIKLFGETVAVNARIATLSAISGHADDKGLLKWAAAFDPKPTRFFVTHGEEPSALTLASRLTNEQGQQTAVPYNGESWDLLNNARVAEGSRERVQKKTAASDGPKKSDSQDVRALDNALRRFSDIAAAARERSAKQLAAFVKQVNALCDRWK